LYYNGRDLYKPFTAAANFLFFFCYRDYYNAKQIAQIGCDGGL